MSTISEELAKLWTSVQSFFTGSSKKVHSILVMADNIANAIKNAEASNIGQLLETGLEAFIPASTGLINAFKLWLPVVVTKLNWSADGYGKTDEHKIADAVSYLNSIKGSDEYAAQLNTLSALIQKWLSDNQGQSITIQQALVTPQLVHNPELVSK